MTARHHRLDESRRSAHRFRFVDTDGDFVHPSGGLGNDGKRDEGNAIHIPSGEARAPARALPRLERPHDRIPLQFDTDARADGVLVGKQRRRKVVTEHDDAVRFTHIGIREKATLAQHELLGADIGGCRRHDRGLAPVLVAHDLLRELS